MIAATSEQVLIVAPRGRDAELASALLSRHGFDVVTCVSGADMVDRIRAGAGCAIVTSEVLDRALQHELDAWLAVQPPWSDFPFIVLTSGGGAVRDTALDLGNMTGLERPVGPPTLLVAVRAALRGRRRQYEAHAAIHRRDQFLAMLSHELRNPLAAIMLASDPLAMEHASKDTLAKRLALVTRQTHHLSRLVNDLLDVARVTSGKVQLRREAVDIDATIRDSVDSIETRAQERQIRFALELVGRAIVEGDVGRLQQVIGNLLNNAIKYSPAGGTITVSSVPLDNGCEIRVRDQGIGIAPEMLPHVFELFAQADASLDRSEGGMGIGLALVDQLVRLHHGSVLASSPGLGKGSEFVVWLAARRSAHGCGGRRPGARDRARSTAARRAGRGQSRFSRTRPGVDRIAGCVTEIAADGEAGVERIVATRPDLALIDIGLPKLDGYEVAKRVRQQLAGPLTLVAMTGYGQSNDRDRARTAGFDDHITKPVRVEMLKALIDTTRARLAATSPMDPAPTAQSRPRT